jgi:hypothetical protein
MAQANTPGKMAPTSYAGATLTGHPQRLLQVVMALLLLLELPLQHQHQHLLQELLHPLQHQLQELLPQPRPQLLDLHRHPLQPPK